MKIILTALTLFAAGCTSGPPLKSKLSYLNGDNYKNKKVTLGIPVNEINPESEDLKNKTKKPL